MEPENRMKQAKKIRIYADWQRETGNWVSSCSDLNGLETEAGSLQALEDELGRIIPELFRASGIEADVALIVNSI